MMGEEEGVRVRKWFSSRWGKKMQLQKET